MHYINGQGKENVSRAVSLTTGSLSKFSLTKYSQPGSLFTKIGRPIDKLDKALRGQNIR